MFECADLNCPYKARVKELEIRIMELESELSKIRQRERYQREAKAHNNITFKDG